MIFASYKNKNKLEFNQRKIIVKKIVDYNNALNFEEEIKSVKQITYEFPDGTYLEKKYDFGLFSIN